MLYKWRVGYGERECLLPSGFTDATLEIAAAIEQIIEEGGDGNGRTPPGEGDGDGLPFRPVPTRASDSEWESVRIGLTNLTEPTARFLGRRKRPALMGRKPVRPDRLLTDPERRIFREDVRGMGGVVVFDCSGSMGVDHEVVRSAVAQFAGATVLAYSNRDTAGSNTYILARNGRMISEHDMVRLPLNSGNGCDGPALRHAVRLRRSPREFVLWVSDYGVTGVGDRQTQDLLYEVADICRKHGIIQVNTCHDALSLLADMKRTGTAPRRHWQDNRLRRNIEAIDEGRIIAPVCRVRYSR